MMYKEFEEIAGYEVSFEDYNNIIEPMYMATNLSKQEFVKCLNRKQFDLNYKKQQLKKQLLSEMKAIANEIYYLCSCTETYEQYEALRAKAIEYIEAFPVWKAPHHDFRREYKNGCSYVKSIVWYDADWNEVQQLELVD